MFKIYALFVFLSSSNCWVFNNVNYKELATKSFDFDLENELENEIDEEYFPQQKFSLIFPGTKWCGSGDVADTYEDLGALRDTDMCCREHDHCPDVIPGGDMKYNLTNDAFYSRLSCECDESFRLCLRDVNSKPSKIIGKTYFNAIGTKCFKNDYPVTGCNRKGGWLNTKCVEYSFDMEGEKRHQWFDVPNYNN